MSPVIGIQTTVLSLIILLILFGNGLVIASVLSCRKLRSVTNQFTVSLAVADIFLALLVLPMSATYLALPPDMGWPFGWTLCRFWMSCDVTCCTASIIHLGLISLDRYIAITDPLRYKVRMSKRKAYFAIASTWIVSMAISFVPIFLDWFSEKNEVGEGIIPPSSSSSSSSSPSPSSFHRFNVTQIEDLQISSDDFKNQMTGISLNTADDFHPNTNHSTNVTTCSIIITTDLHLSEAFICAIKPNTIYAIISACTSFYVPFLVMTVFYTKIYRIAQRQRNEIRSQSQQLAPTQQINTSSKTAPTKTTRSLFPMFMTDVWKKRSTVHCNLEVSSVDSIITEHLAEDIRTAFSTSAPTNLTLKPVEAICDKIYLNPPSENISRQSPMFQGSLRPYLITNEDRISTSLTDFSNAFTRQDGLKKDKCLLNSISQQNLQVLKVQNIRQNGYANQNASTNMIHPVRSSDCLSQLSGVSKPRQKTRNDYKAIKTLGVLMGVFCTCWLPFFIMYLLLPFCDLPACLEIPRWVEDAITWLGYCNSLFNPCVYALTNRDFKEAYWKLIRFRRCSL